VEVSKDDFLRWLQNPVTEEVYQVLRERREKIAEQLAAGLCLGAEIEHAKAVGRCEEIKDMLELTYEDMLHV
jgi:hypothetical protein